MENLGIASVAAITVITYLMGMAVRASRMDNKWIPILCGLLGGLLGTVLILGLRLRLLGLRGLLGFLLGSLGLGGFRLGRLRLGRGLHGKHLLQRRDLVGLGHAVKHQIQFLIGEHLRIGLRLLKILGDDVRDHLRRNAEIRRDLLQTILH